MKKNINLIALVLISLSLLNCNSNNESNTPNTHKVGSDKNTKNTPKNSRYEIESIGKNEFVKLGGKDTDGDTTWQHKDNMNVLTKNKNFVHRDGLDLKIQGENNQVIFKNSTDTFVGEGDYYYIIGEEPSINSYIIRYLTIENFFTIIVNRKLCDTSTIDGYVYFSPDRQKVFTVKNFELNDCKGTVYYRNGTKFIASFSFPLNNLLTIETAKWINSKTIVFKMWDNTNQKARLYKYFKLTIL